MTASTPWRGLAGTRGSIMRFVRGARSSLVAAAVLALALTACGREAPLDERVRQRLAKQDHDGALAILDQRLQREPGDQAARALRVRVLLRAGRVDAAIDAYAGLPEDHIGQDASLARELVMALVQDALR